MIQQFRKLVRFHNADLVFTDEAIKEIARIALERGTGARGLRAVVEEVLEGVLFEVEAGVRYRDREDGQGWGGGQAEYDADEGTAGARLNRRLASEKYPRSWSPGSLRSLRVRV